MSAWDRAEEAADIPWWQKVLVLLGYGFAWPASLAALWVLSKASTWPWPTWSRALNSPIAYMVATIAVVAVGRRVLRSPVGDLFGAISIGLWIGTTEGFWRGAAYVVIMSGLLFASSYAMGLAMGLWHVCRSRRSERS